MYHGKFTRKQKKPAITWLLVAFAILSFTSGGVAAYLSTSTTLQKNTLTIDNPVNPVVDPSTYTITIQKDSPAHAVYVRAAVVATWEKDGEVLAETPVPGTDYTINATDWFSESGFWYYKSPVFPSSTTDQTLILVTNPSNADKNGYTLHMDILVQTIQVKGTTDGANPVDAVEAAWGIPKTRFN